MRPKNNIPEKTTHGICCTTPEMVTRWVVWASIGCHMGGGVLINHRHPCPNPRQKKNMVKIGENIGRYSIRFSQNESLIGKLHKATKRTVLSRKKNNKHQMRFMSLNQMVALELPGKNFSSSNVLQWSCETNMFKPKRH